MIIYSFMVSTILLLSSLYTDLLTMGHSKDSLTKACCLPESGARRSDAGSSWPHRGTTSALVAAAIAVT